MKTVKFPIVQSSYPEWNQSFVFFVKIQNSCFPEMSLLACLRCSSPVCVKNCPYSATKVLAVVLHILQQYFFLLYFILLFLKKSIIKNSSFFRLSVGFPKCELSGLTMNCCPHPSILASQTR